MDLSIYAPCLEYENQVMNIRHSLLFEIVFFYIQVSSVTSFGGARWSFDPDSGGSKTLLTQNANRARGSDVHARRLRKWECNAFRKLFRRQSLLNHVRARIGSDFVIGRTGTGIQWRWGD